MITDYSVNWKNFLLLGNYGKMMKILNCIGIYGNPNNFFN